jgi:2-desacetyl-2-hydroxyethyl bacteriochlorophyllide A dehydrogenase
MMVVNKPVPVVGPDQVLVQVHRATLCGTDIKIRSRKFFSDGGPPPGSFTPGHEYAGVVAAVGASVDEVAVGDRVVSESHRGCNRCANCLRGAYTDCLNYGQIAKGHSAQGMTVDGGFAQYVLNPVSTVHKLPDNVNFDEAALLTTAGTAMHALDVLGARVTGAHAAVLGPGPVGLLAVQLLRELGASFVALSGTRHERLAIGEDYGADLIINANAQNPVEVIREVTGGVGVDVVLECSGDPAAAEQALQMTQRGGDVVLVGFFDTPVTLSLNTAVMDGITMHGVRGEGTDSLARAIALASRERLRLNDLITHHYPLSSIDEAMTAYESRADGAIKVMLDIAGDST